MERVAVYSEINAERDRQDAKWGTIKEHPHTMARWLSIALNELAEAIEANEMCRPYATRVEVVHVAAVLVAALEQHGMV